MGLSLMLLIDISAIVLVEGMNTLNAFLRDVLRRVLIIGSESSLYASVRVLNTLST